MKISEKRVRLVFVVLAMIGILFAMGLRPFGKGRATVWVVKYESGRDRLAKPDEIELAKRNGGGVWLPPGH